MVVGVDRVIVVAELVIKKISESISVTVDCSVEEHVFPPLDCVPVVWFIVTVIFLRDGSVDTRIPMVSEFRVDGLKSLIEVMSSSGFEKVKVSFNEFVFKENHEGRQCESKVT